MKQRRTPLCWLLLVFGLALSIFVGHTPVYAANQTNATSIPVTTVTPTKAPANFNPGHYDVAAEAAVVLDAKSGQVLYAKNATTVLPVASMSKMVGLYLVLQAVKEGRIRWTDTIAPNEAQAALSEDTALSNVPLTAGTEYTVKELYDAAWIYSANVAIMLLGQKLAGSQANFVDQMQMQLKKWDIHDAKIVNASGLNNSLLGDLMIPGTGVDQENEMTPYDIAQVAQHILDDYPEVIETTKIAKQTFREHQAGSFEMTNWNMLLPGLQSYDATLPVDGLKTGTSDAAGECFTATINKDGRRLISVVAKAQGAPDDKTKRFVATANLLKATFATWQYDRSIEAKQALPKVQKLKVIHGKKEYVPLSFAKSQKVWHLKKNSEVAGELKLVQKFKHGIQAPVKAGQTVGQFQLSKDEYIYLQQTPKISVTTKTSISKLPWIQILFNKIF